MLDNQTSCYNHPVHHLVEAGLKLLYTVGNM